MAESYQLLTKKEFFRLFVGRVTELLDARGVASEERDRIFRELFQRGNEPHQDHKNPPCFDREMRQCIAEAVRGLRTEAGTTQEEVSLRAQLPLRFVQEVETSNVEDVTYYDLYRIGYGIGLDPLAETAVVLRRVFQVRQANREHHGQPRPIHETSQDDSKET